MTTRVLHGDVRDILPTLPDASVHCVVTSPPYWGLRDYGTALWAGGDPGCGHIEPRGRPQDQNGLAAAAERADGVPRNSSGPREAKRELPFRDICGKCGARRVDRQIGSEETPDEWIATLVAVFREVKRILRPDGVCFVNVGDSYATSSAERLKTQSGAAQRPCCDQTELPAKRIPSGLKPKDLLLLPARLALALQGDGWWVRSMLPWVKRSAMPESVTDRPASAIEYVFLLTKSARYYWDGAAVARGGATEPHAPGNKTVTQPPTKGARDPAYDPQRLWGSSCRNFRNSDLFYDSLEPPHGLICDAIGEPLALDVNPAAFSSAHFATFPPKLVEPLIRAGTSERGCCAACGAPWTRVVERTATTYDGRKHPSPSHSSETHRRDCDAMQRGIAYASTTTGWTPSCRCDAGVVPCVVLDPFMGSGTTGLVASCLQRNAIGIELSAPYTAMAEARVVDDAPLFAWGAANGFMLEAAE